MSDFKMSMVWTNYDSPEFKFKEIKDLVLRYAKTDDMVLDIFAGEQQIKDALRFCSYRSNDTERYFPTEFNLKVEEFLNEFPPESADIILCNFGFQKVISEERREDIAPNKFYSIIEERDLLASRLRKGGYFISWGSEISPVYKRLNFQVVEVLQMKHENPHKSTYVIVGKKK